MSDIVWSIHPRNDNMKDLSLRMRRFAVDVLSARGIEFDIRIPEEDLSLGPEARRCLERPIISRAALLRSTRALVSPPRVTDDAGNDGGCWATSTVIGRCASGPARGR